MSKIKWKAWIIIINETMKDSKGEQLRKLNQHCIIKFARNNFQYGKHVHSYFEYIVLFLWRKNCLSLNSKNNIQNVISIDFFFW